MARVQKVFNEPSRTKQSAAKECDINEIMAKVRRGQVVTHYNRRQPEYFDAASVPDFRGAQEVYVRARAAFEALPSGVRKRFHNDPAELFEFVADPQNLDEGRKLGIIQPAVEKPADVVSSPKEVKEDGKS